MLNTPRRPGRRLGYIENWYADPVVSDDVQTVLGALEDADSDVDDEATMRLAEAAMRRLEARYDPTKDQRKGLLVRVQPSLDPDLRQRADRGLAIAERAVSVGPYAVGVAGGIILTLLLLFLVQQMNDTKNNG